jgi:hypothetical protein
MVLKAECRVLACVSLLVLTVFACRQPGPSVPVTVAEFRPCTDTWVFTGSVSERKLNDSVVQQVVDGRVWFEVVAPKMQADGSTRAFIRNFRMDGSLLSEGYAVYWEHPVADYTEVGDWKHYDCKGKLRRP